jgi:hypothetical protein
LVRKSSGKVGILLETVPEQQKEQLSHLVQKVLLLLGVDFQVDSLSRVFITKSLLLPGLNVSTIATSSVRLFYDYFMSFMVGIFKAFHALNARVVSCTVVALGNFDKVKKYLFPLAR